MCLEIAEIQQTLATLCFEHYMINYMASMSIEKIKILGAVLELLAK